MHTLKELLGKVWLPYVLPFALFLLFTEPARYFPSLVSFLYVAKTVLVGPDELSLRLTFGECVVGTGNWEFC